MTVFCIIPVHDRLAATREVLRQLSLQDFESLSTVIVDDGSTDGTAEMVTQEYPEVKVIRGDGTMWWGGAMAAGLDSVLPLARDGDSVLFQNDDTRFLPDYVSTLVSVSERHGRAIVGSVIKDLARPETTLSIAPRIDYWRIRIWDVLQDLLAQHGTDPAALVLPETIRVDALCGRGTLFPVEVFRRVGGLRSKLLPHYLADYEISARAKAAGFDTLVSSRAVVWTDARDSGINHVKSSLAQSLFDRRSRVNIVDSTVFFTLCGPWYLRLSAPLRVALFRAWRELARRLSSR